LGLLYSLSSLALKKGRNAPQEEIVCCFQQKRASSVMTTGSDFHR
jgi:hypothetical protein